MTVDKQRRSGMSNLAQMLLAGRSSQARGAGERHSSLAFAAGVAWWLFSAHALPRCGAQLLAPPRPTYMLCRIEMRLCLARQRWRSASTLAPCPCVFCRATVLWHAGPAVLVVIRVKCTLHVDCTADVAKKSRRAGKGSMRYLLEEWGGGQLTRPRGCTTSAGFP